MSNARRKPSKRQKRAQARRAKEPADWHAFLRPVIEELPVAMEIAERLSWALKLKRRGVEFAPGRFGPQRYESRLPWSPSSVIPSRTVRVLANLKTPEEMAASIDLRTLETLKAKWEMELASWGRALLKTMGETLRLRQERAELLEAVEETTSFFEGMSRFEAARVHDELRSNPDQPPLETRHGIVSRAIVMCDEFGNELYEGPSEEIMAEIARPARDDRALRRILKGEQKKALGGVLDINPTLLRSTDDREADKRRDLSVLDREAPEDAE